MEEKKTSILALLKILEENSDKDHKIKQPKLLEMIESQYGIKLDRRTLYKNVQMLQDFGYDIETYSDNNQGYYLADRAFEPSQIFLLCNAIHASNFIPSKSSKELIDNLLATQSKYIKTDFNNMVFVENKNKKENKQFFLNVELISEAIKERKAISFNYTKYNTKKELVNRREELYFYSPYYMVYSKDKAYMIAKSEKHDDFTHFRIDRMKDIKFSDKPYVRLNKQEDPYEYAKTKIYMFHGENERIAIKCDYSILDDVIDTFGKDISIDEDKDFFTAYVKSSKEGMIYFALQYLKHMEVLEPEDLRDEIKEVIKSGSKKYK